MKSQLVKRLCKKYILPSLPTYNTKGHLLYQMEYEDLLRGFCFESSGFSSNTFTIVVFIQPLYIPKPYISYGFGNRLGILSKGRDVWWEYSEEKVEEIMQEILGMIQHHGLPYLERAGTLERFIKQYGHFDRFKIADVHRMEAIGYGYLLSGNTKSAKKLLDTLSKELEREIIRYPDEGWQKEMQSRVQLILGYLQNQDQEAAKQQLGAWKNYTLLHLGIKETWNG